MPPVSVLALRDADDGLRRVLMDARCSFVEEDGHFFLVDGPTIEEGHVPWAAALAESLLDPASGALRASVSLGTGPVAGGALRSPVGLLEWLLSQRVAASMHPTAEAYLGSSDPDDILPFLPYHPRRAGLALATVALGRASAEQGALRLAEPSD